MPATLSVRDQFSWDQRTLRYRRRGKFVSERAVKLGVRRVIRNAQAEMRAIGDQVARGELSVAEFQSRMSSELKNLHVSGAMAGQGGPANMTQSDYLRVGRALKVQYRRLERFSQQISDGELWSTQIRQRVELYVKGMAGAYEDGRRSSAIAVGYDEERNVLGRNENHCKTGVREGCADLTAQGWVTIGTMPPPGSRTCLSNCLCSFTFRKRPG